MSLELLNTFATLGTFVVIAATATAAIVQLRHARGSNQIAALSELHDASQTPEFVAAQHFVTTELRRKLEDPNFRYQLNERRARTSENQALIAQINAIANYFESLGMLVKMGFVDRELVLDIWSGVALAFWDELAPVAAIMRRREGEAGWENFEYVAVLAQDWIAAHPRGSYPVGVRRIHLKDAWLEADAKFEASVRVGVEPL